MSADVSSHRDKDVTIPDELESFFHVLLWHGIRYLRHNCDDVGNFMTRFFDAAEYYGKDRFECGSAKQTAMEKGKIMVHKGLLLVFTHDSPDKTADENPLNELIREAMSYFKAYYAVRARDMATTPAVNRRTVMMKRALIKEGALDEDEVNTPETTTLDASTEKRAESLASHSGMVRMINIWAENHDDWPLYDKTEDQLPKSYDERKEKDYLMPARSKRSNSVMELEDKDTEQTQIKRLRTGTSSRLPPLPAPDFRAGPSTVTRAQDDDDTEDELSDTGVAAEIVSVSDLED